MSTSGKDPYQLFGRWTVLWGTTSAGSMLTIAAPAVLIFDLTPDAFTILCGLLTSVVSPWASYVIVYSRQRRTLAWRPPRWPPGDNPEPPTAPSPPGGRGSTLPERITQLVAPTPASVDVVDRVVDHWEGNAPLPAGTYRPLSFLPEPSDPAPVRKGRTTRLIGVIR